MKNKKLLMLSLLALTPAAICSCVNKPNDSGQSSTSEAISSSESKSSSSSSSETVSEVTVVLDFAGVRSNITLTLKLDEEIDLGKFSYSVSGADATSWSDGTKTYSPTDKVKAKDGLKLTGTFVKYSAQFTLAEDGKSYSLSALTDGFITDYTVPTSYHALPVKAIGDGAFYGKKSLKTLVIPDSIEKIGEGILTNTEVEEVTLPFIGETLEDTDTYIGRLFGFSLALQGAIPSTFKKIKITKQETIDVSSFENVSSLEKVELVNSKMVSSKAFYGCSSIKELVLNEGLKTIENYAFYGLKNLVSVELPSTLETYNNGFSSCGIESLHFGKALKEYSDLNTNLSLKEISVSSDNSYFSDANGVLFNKDKSVLLTYPAGKSDESYKIPDSVKELGNSAFKCAKAKSVDLNKVEKMGTECFRYSSLEEVSFPSTLVSIGKTSFSGSKVSKVNFAESLVGAETLTLGEFMFSSCTKLKELTVPAYLKKLPDYFVATESLEKITFLGSLSSIGGLAFAGSQIKELETTFDDSATIGERIFNNCGLLTTWKVHFVDGVTNYPTLTHELGFGSFCPSILCDSEEIVTALKEKWTDVASRIDVEKVSPFVIEDGVLKGYNGEETDTDVVVPEGVTRIAKEVFKNKKYIKHLTLPSTLQILEQNITSGCSSLKDVTITNDDPSVLKYYYWDVQHPEGVEKPKLFGNILGGFTNSANNTLIYVKSEEAKTKLLSLCSSKDMYKNQVYAQGSVSISDDEVKSSDGKTLIRYYGSEEDIKIADGITSIAEKCFHHNSSIKTIDFNEVTTIGKDSFSYTGLTTLTIPETVTSIGEDSFAYNDDLESVTIQAAIVVTSYAFESCPNLGSLDLGNKITGIEDDILSGSCGDANDGDGIDTITVPASVTNVTACAFEDATIQNIVCLFTEDYASDTFDDGLDFVDNTDAEVTFLEE